MKNKLFAITVAAMLTATAFAQEVLFKSDFEQALPNKSSAIEIHPHADAKLIRVTDAEEPAAAGASTDSKGALMIQGGEEQQHSWHPAIDIQFPPQTNAVLKISFSFRNASFNASMLGLQVTQKEESTYEVYQHMNISPKSIRMTGTGRSLFKRGITSGFDSKWHRVNWTIPLPGTKGMTPTLKVDGEDQGSIRMEPHSEICDKVNNVRFWLTTVRDIDTKFLIDDVEIVILPATPQPAP